jgi:hypothetical protein
VEELVCDSLANRLKRRHQWSENPVADADEEAPENAEHR